MGNGGEVLSKYFGIKNRRDGCIQYAQELTISSKVTVSLKDGYGLYDVGCIRNVLTAECIVTFLGL